MTRHYSADEIALFAKHRDRRAEQRPECCNRGPACWVEQGPPAMPQRQRCTGCGGVPVDPLTRRGGRPHGRKGRTL